MFCLEVNSRRYLDFKQSLSKKQIEMYFLLVLSLSYTSGCYSHRFYFIESQDWTSSLSLDSLQKLPIYNCLLERAEVVYYFFCADIYIPHNFGFFKS